MNAAFYVNFVSEGVILGPARLKMNENESKIAGKCELANSTFRIFGFNSFIFSRAITQNY